MKLKKTILFVLAVFTFNQTARACEPILPFMEVVGGPLALTNSWIVLFVAVVIKSIVFSALQKKLNYVRGLLYMITGNILTTFIGIIAAALIGSGPIFAIGILIVWPLCLMPAERFFAVMKRPWLERLTPGSFAGIMVLALAASCFLFSISSVYVDSNHLIIYWVWKLAAIYIALIVSILLTAFWEEWVVWKLSRCAVDYTGYVQPVIRANLVVLFCVMLFSAGITLPQRLKSPNFLVQFGLIARTIIEAKINL